MKLNISEDPADNIQKYLQNLNGNKVNSKHLVKVFNLSKNSVNNALNRLYKRNLIIKEIKDRECLYYYDKHKIYFGKDML